LNSNNINITGIIITDMREHDILISGDNHYINNNTIFSCSLHTKAIPEEERYVDGSLVSKFLTLIIPIHLTFQII